MVEKEEWGRHPVRRVWINYKYEVAARFAEESEEANGLRNHVCMYTTYKKCVAARANDQRRQQSVQMHHHYTGNSR